MEVWRTVPVKLDVSDSANDSLLETIEEFRWATNFVVERAVDDDGYVVTDKQTLHDRTYFEVRDRTRLHSNLVQAARNGASDALKSVVTRWSNGQRASLPTFEAEFLDYDKRSATFHDDHATLATVDGRVDCRYVLPTATEKTPHREYLFNAAFETTGATLHRRDGEWFLHLRTKTEVEPIASDTEHRTVLGVDLNVTGSIAVTSTGAFVESADRLNHYRDQYEQTRGSLQRAGTRSAHQRIARNGSKFTRWSTNLLHHVANEIVSEAIGYRCTHIALEDLTYIRDRIGNDKQFQQWAFRRLYEFVEYKAEARGMTVEQVDPAHTSQQCSKCGSIHSDNRHDKSFVCRECGYELNADYNAAKNIANRCVRRGQKSHGGRATCRLALKSGTLSGNGCYIPASGEA